MKLSRLLVLICALQAVAVDAAGAAVTLVEPPAPITDQSVTVHDFTGPGVIEGGTAVTAELAFNGLFLFVDAFDGDGLTVEVALSDADDPFRPLKNFASGERVGPEESYGTRGDVIFNFSESTDGLMGFRFSADGGQSHQYGWVEFHWVTLTIADRLFDFFTVNRAAWTTVPGQTIHAGTILIPTPGDANHDGQVTGADLIAVQQNFGNVETGDATGLLPGDANNDGRVTGTDLIAVQQHFGTTTSATTIEATPVPEPTTLALAACAGMAPLRRRDA